MTACPKVGVTDLAFKPPRPVRGKLQTVASFTLGGLVEVRGLVVENHTGAACFLWPAVSTRGGRWVKTVRLRDVAQRDAVERCVLDAYRRGRESGELPGETLPLPRRDTADDAPLEWPDYLRGLRRGNDWREGMKRLNDRCRIRVYTAVLRIYYPRVGLIPARDALLVGLIFRQIHNQAFASQCKRDQRAARNVRRMSGL
jgi:hypothetical protein